MPQLARYPGREVYTTGDSFFASFDGPARHRLPLASTRSPPAGKLVLVVQVGDYIGQAALYAARLSNRGRIR